jgi:hypothetical protein
MMRGEIKLGNSEEFDTLVYAYLDGILGDSGIHQLRTCLLEGRCIQRFAEICQLNQLIHEVVTVDICVEESPPPWPQAEKPEPISSLFWQELAEAEKVAPAVGIPQEKPPQQLYKVTYPASKKREVRKFTIVTLFISVAAMLLLFLLLKFDIGRNIYENEAILTDSINGSFADLSKPMEIGDSLSSTKGEYWLQGGFIKLLFHDGAEVVIEAPARFEILSGSEMNLLRGQAYSTVPKRAVGFTLYTPDSHVIDLGTEFGIKVEPNGSEVYVTKGKASLVPEGDIRTRRPIELAAGLAKQIDKNGLTKDIQMDNQLFVSDISSKMRVVYRGEKAVPVGRWEKQLQINPTTDLRTDGQLVQAVNLGFQAKPVTVAGISFEPYSASGPVSVEGGIDIELTANPFYTGSDKNLLGLLEKSRQLNDKKNTWIEIGLDQLEVGKMYRIQLIIGFKWKWCDVNCYGVNREYIYFPNPGKSGLGLATYTWRAQSPSETVKLTSPEDNNNVVHIFGYVIHRIDQERLDRTRGSEFK